MVKALPPLTTYRSGWPSPLASKNAASTSSAMLSAANAGCSLARNEPSRCCSSSVPVRAIAVHVCGGERGALGGQQVRDERLAFELAVRVLDVLHVEMTPRRGVLEQ